MVCRLPVLYCKQLTVDRGVAESVSEGVEEVEEVEAVE